MKEWLTSIVYISIFSTGIDVISSSSKFNKFIKLVMSFIVISVVVSPVINFLLKIKNEEVNIDVIDGLFKDVEESHQKEFESTYQEIMTQKYETELKNIINNNIGNKYEVKDVKIILDENNEDFVCLEVMVKKLLDKRKEVENVESIEIDLSMDEKKKGTNDEIDRLRKQIANIVSKDEEKIKIYLG